MGWMPAPLDVSIWNSLWTVEKSKKQQNSIKNSIFDFNLRSCSDFYLNSDRGNMNNHRLANNWRPVWQNMFKEFPNPKFIMHHIHDAVKFPVPDNVSVKTYDSKAKMDIVN